MKQSKLEKKLNKSKYNLTTHQVGQIKSALLKMLPKKHKTCDCEETLGYHTKYCDLYDFGWNEAIDQIISLIQEA